MWLTFPPAADGYFCAGSGSCVGKPISFTAFSVLSLTNSAREANQVSSNTPEMITSQLLKVDRNNGPFYTAAILCLKVRINTGATNSIIRTPALERLNGLQDINSNECFGAPVLLPVFSDTKRLLWKRPIGISSFLKQMKRACMLRNPSPDISLP